MPATRHKKNKEETAEEEVKEIETSSVDTTNTEEQVERKETAADQVETVETKAEETIEAETATKTQNMEPAQKESTISFPTADFGGPKKSGSGKVIATIIIILAALGAIVGGSIFYYTQKTQSTNTGTTGQEEAKTPSTAPATPTPEETAEIDLFEYNAQILNGSGIVGEAGKVEALLKKAGMEDIETGNAKTYDFTDTEVQLVADSPSRLYAAVQNALAGYSVKKGTNLSEDSEFDMIITVGSKKSSATITPTKEEE